MSSPPAAVLLVDGYNIIGTWNPLKHLRDRHGLDAARWKLTQTLTDYSAFQGYKTELIFDAQFRSGAGSSERVSESLAICFTDFGETADTYIEKLCALTWQNRHRCPQRTIVATSDRTHQLMVVGYGAEWISAQQLEQQVKSVTYLMRQKQKSAKSAPGRLLAHSLDPAAKNRLERLRLGLG